MALSYIHYVLLIFFLDFVFLSFFSFFFFNDTATTEIYTLSLHDALPISCRCSIVVKVIWLQRVSLPRQRMKQWLLLHAPDRKSTRLNSSHLVISYAVFCLKKKKKNKKKHTI